MNNIKIYSKLIYYYLFLFYYSLFYIYLKGEIYFEYMEASKGTRLGKKSKIGNTPEMNFEEYEKYKQSIKKENQKELAFFFLNELVGEYGYKAVINSLDKNSSERNDSLDDTIQNLIEKLGKDILQENIYYYRNINVNEYKNYNYNDNNSNNK